MKKLKALFFSRNSREKTLLLLFMLLVCSFWGARVFKEGKLAFGRYTSSKALLDNQAIWLGSRERIEAEAKAAVATLDPARTFDSSKLLAEVNRMAAEAQITSGVQADDTKDETTPVFTLHSIRVTMRKANYASLVEFYKALHKRAPYIGLEQFSLRVENPSAPTNLTAVFRLSSVEVQAR